MNASAFSKISILQPHFAKEKLTGDEISVRLAALQRDSESLNGKFDTYLAKGIDVLLVLLEVRENLVERAQAHTDFAEHSNRVAALCREYADLIQQITQ